MAPVAYVHSQLAELRLENRMTGVPLHVVGGLIEVTHPGNVVLAVLAQVATTVRDDHCRIPNGLAMLHISLQNRVDDNHIVSLGQLCEHLGCGTVFGFFGKLTPRKLLASAEGKGHGYRK